MWKTIIIIASYDLTNFTTHIMISWWIMKIIIIFDTLVIHFVNVEAYSRLGQINLTLLYFMVGFKILCKF